MPKKIAICHYRVGGTDGTSLEIQKRKEILEKRGHQVYLIAGNRSNGADYIIPELEWDDGIVPIIKENGFIYFNRKYLGNSELKKKIEGISRVIEKKLNNIQLKEKFDTVLVHNIFSFGGHIAAAKSFANWIKKFKIPTIATHHDFFWEREEFRIPRSNYLKEYMLKYMPPQNPCIKHIVINSLAQHGLKQRNNIESTVLPDIFDFNQKSWTKDKFNEDFLKQFDIKQNDLIIFQATRVIPRKNIEISIDFTETLQKKINRLKSKKLYNGKKINRKSRIILILAGYTEDEKRIYLFKLKTKAFENRVLAKFIANNVKAERSFYYGTKTYSLWDVYAYADLITFPSIWEGWGNQFIEAVFAKKPIVIFEYPVFKKDIKPEGYQIISLGDKIEGKDENGFYKLPQKNIDKAANQAIKWLLDKNLDKKLEYNFKIGKQFHDYQILEDFFDEHL